MCSARTFGTGILGSGTGPNTKAIVAVGGGDARRLRAITAPGCWSATLLRALGPSLGSLKLSRKSVKLSLLLPDDGMRLLEQVLRQPLLTVLQSEVAAKRRQLLGRRAGEPVGRAQLGVLGNQPKYVVLILE